jgi:hypothetical protein
VGLKESPSFRRQIVTFREKTLVMPFGPPFVRKARGFVSKTLLYMTFLLSFVILLSQNTKFLPGIVFISLENFTLLVRKITFLVRKITLLTEMAFFLSEIVINR